MVAIGYVLQFRPCAWQAGKAIIIAYVRIIDTHGSMYQFNPIKLHNLYIGNYVPCQIVYGFLSKCLQHKQYKPVVDIPQSKVQYECKQHR